MSNLFSVTGKVALVTGGTSGIGLMIARGLVEHGARVYIVGRDAGTCESVALSLSDSGMCRALPGDLSTLGGIEAVAAALKAREGSLDILVNNAGGMYDAPLDQFTEAGWDSIADLNLQLLLRSVDAQVRSSAALLASSQAAFHVAADTVKYARQNVEETEILYRQGLATALELVDANDSRFTAEVNYATAQFAMAQAYLGLRQALGLEVLGTEVR